MKKKPRFDPEITRVKLNPEQAVLTCNCWATGRIYRGGPRVGDAQVCQTTRPGLTIVADRWVVSGGLS